MSASNTSPQTPPASAGRVTFYSTLNSADHSTRSSHEGPTSPKIELYKEEVFENNLTQLFTKNFLAVLTGKEAVLKEVRISFVYCKMKNKRAKTSIFTFIRSGTTSTFNLVAYALRRGLQSVLEYLHVTNPGSWGMITLCQYAF